MKIAEIIARSLVGLVFVVFGLNFFFGFIEIPEKTGDAATFMGILYTSGYLMVVKVLEIIGGALLLAGSTTSGLIIITPILVNIFLYHLFLDPQGMGMTAVLLVLVIFLIIAHWNKVGAIICPLQCRSKKGCCHKSDEA